MAKSAHSKRVKANNRIKRVRYNVKYKKQLEDVVNKRKVKKINKGNTNIYTLNISLRLSRAILLHYTYP